MSKVILFEKDDGLAGILYPAPNIAPEVAGARGVRQGAPFLIVEEEELPSSQVERDSLQLDLSEPDGFGGNPNA